MVMLAHVAGAAGRRIWWPDRLFRWQWDGFRG
jgi:hypothetical protein